MKTDFPPFYMFVLLSTLYPPHVLFLCEMYGWVSCLVLYCPVLSCIVVLPCVCLVLFLLVCLCLFVFVLLTFVLLLMCALGWEVGCDWGLGRVSLCVLMGFFFFFSCWGSVFLSFFFYFYFLSSPKLRQLRNAAHTL